MAAIKTKKTLITAYQSAWLAEPIFTSLSSLFIVINLVLCILFLTKTLYSNSLHLFLLLLPFLIIQIDNLKDWREAKALSWPRWINGVALFNLAAGSIVQIIAITLELNQSFSGLPAITEAIALYLLLPTLLPRLISLLAHLTRKIPGTSENARNWLIASNLYAVILTCSMITIIIIFFILFDINYQGLFDILSLILILYSFGLAISLRTTLWIDDRPLWSTLLPHIPLWSLVIIGPFDDHMRQMLPRIRLDDTVLISLAFISISLGLTGMIYWLSQRLRCAPVKASATKTTQSADSIQAMASHYVDSRGLSQRLRDSIIRANGGVFGITGVRGAGKSALTRHVLSELTGSNEKVGYFTTEVTAPVRHDENMGFFIAVCRNVCNKVMDDLEPIIKGPKNNSLLTSRLRNLTALSLLGVAAISLLIHISSGTTTLKTNSFPLDNPYSETDDPLLGPVSFYKIFPLYAERQSIDALLQQINQALLADTDSQRRINNVARYLLVPSKGQKTINSKFLLLPLAINTDEKKALQRYKSTFINTTHPYQFFIDKKNQNFEKLKLSFNNEEDWDRQVSKITEHSNIAKPLHHLSSELKHYLLPETPKNVNKKSGAIGSQQNFLSYIILRAFSQADPGLVFDYSKLEQFAETLHVYRALLDGKVITRPSATQATDNSNLTGTNMRQLLDPFSSLTAATLWSIALSMPLLFLLAPTWQSISSLTRATVNRRYLDAYSEAENFKQQLVFHSSQESNAGFSWQGLSLGRKQTLAMRDLTIPGLTARYTKFLQKVKPLYNGKLIIAIDELDKVSDPEHVKALLTEIKGALFMEGTYYIISISEDAARSFRRRLASGRDIFESTFDDVIDIQQMEVMTAVQMLTMREETGAEDNRLPEYCLVISALFGGGIPREIIRARRTLSYAMKDQADVTIEWAVHTLLREELQQWEGHLAETNLSGNDTIALRQKASIACNQLNQNPKLTESYIDVWNTLDSCISIVDPKKLRHSVGFIAEDGMELSDTARQYQQIASDLQMLIRLMILTHLSELVLSDIDYKDYLHRVLECHSTLADKPALAEMLMKELKHDQQDFTPRQESFTTQYTSNKDSFK